MGEWISDQTRDSRTDIILVHPGPNIYAQQMLSRFLCQFVSLFAVFQ